MVLLTTETVRPLDRFAYWREVVSQHFVHLRPDQVVRGLFHGEIWAKNLGGVSVSQVTSAGNVFSVPPPTSRARPPRSTS